MIRGSIKKGVTNNDIASKQLEAATLTNRKRRDDFIRSKRGRIERTVSTDSLPSSAVPADINKLDEYASLLRGKDPTRAAEAARQIRRLLSQENGIYVNSIIQKGLIPTIISNISQEQYPKLQFECVWALTNIASGTHEQTEQMVENGAIQQLLALIQSDHIEVQEQAIWALGNISGDCAPYRETILGLNGFSMIVEFASHNMDKLGVVKNSIWCLSNLCRNQERKEGYFAYIQPHLAFLKELLAYSNIDIVVDACWAFGFLTDADAAQKKIVIPFIPECYLVRLIMYDDTRLQCAALRVAGNIVSGDRDDTQLMLQAGLLQALIRILPTSKESQKKEILWIISNITAGTPQQIKVVIDIGLIKYLVSLLSTDSLMIQTEIMWCICNAINGGSGEQIRYIVEKQVVGPIIRFLSSTTNALLIRNILISINRILKVGNHIQKHCQLDSNPYYTYLDEAGGVDKVWEIMETNNPEYTEICEHILRYCDLEEKGEEELPNF